MRRGLGVPDPGTKPVHELLDRHAASGGCKNNILYLLIQIFITERKQLVAAIADQIMEQKQCRALVAVGEPVVARHRLHQGGSLLPDFSIITAIGTRNRSRDTFKAAQLERSLVSAKCAREVNPVMLFTPLTDLPVS